MSAGASPRPRTPGPARRRTARSRGGPGRRRPRVPKQAAAVRRVPEARDEPGGLGRVERRAVPGELRPVTSPVVLALGEVRPDPLDRQPAAATSPRNAGRSSGGHTPTRCIPVSTFTCTPCGPARPRRRRASPSRECSVGVSRCASATGLRARRELRQHEDRRLDPGGAELETLLDQRDAAPRRAALERRARRPRPRRGRTRWP